MSAHLKNKLITVSAGFVLVLLGVLLGIAIFYHTASPEPEAAVGTSIAVPQPKAPREVRDVLTNSDGDLIITYSDGSVQNAGRVKGSEGAGQAPTSAQINAALIEYCAGGRCDAKAPNQEQIIAALAIYCSGGICKGDQGQDAAPITAEQIAAAVTDYCANGRCQGASGQAGTNGTNGSNGRDPIIACIERGQDQFVAWKYIDEADSAYRDIYRLPVTAECDDPVFVGATV